jgi:hypothetical protein
VDWYIKGVHGFLKVFELYSIDEFGVAYVSEAYDSIHQAKQMLEEALSHARTPEEASKIQGFLHQVEDELFFL